MVECFVFLRPLGLRLAIKEGVKKDDKTLMKAFSDLSDEQVKGLVAYVRALKK